MHLIVDLARDLAIVAMELVLLIFLAWCLSATLRERKGGKADTSLMKPLH